MPVYIEKKSGDLVGCYHSGTDGQQTTEQGKIELLRLWTMVCWDEQFRRNPYLFFCLYVWIFLYSFFSVLFNIFCPIALHSLQAGLHKWADVVGKFNLRNFELKALDVLFHMVKALDIEVGPKILIGFYMWNFANKCPNFFLSIIDQQISSCRYLEVLHCN